MTDQPETLAPYRLPWRRDHLKQAAVLAPVLRYVPRHPALLLGAAAVGIAGVLAWRNREKIKVKTAPLVEDARARGKALVEEAKTKSSAAVSKAKSKSKAVAAKTRTRRATNKPAVAAEPTASPLGATPAGPPDLH